MPFELDDEAQDLVDAVAEFIHTCDDDPQRAEVRRLLVLACHTLSPQVVEFPAGPGFPRRDRGD